MDVPSEKFEEIVSEVLNGLPDKFKEKINNLAVFVEDFATPKQLGKTGRNSQAKYELLGLYEGYVQSSRKNVGVVFPDKITIFRVPVMQECSTEEELKKSIAGVVIHEIAHHFGSDEKGARKAEKVNK
jgi:predicted Zn-dependent protease with MMP-like domain